MCDALYYRFEAVQKLFGKFDIKANPKVPKS